MRPGSAFLRFVLLAALVGAVALAQAPNPAGHWEGNVQSPEGEVGMVVDLDQNERGEWMGDFDAPSRNMSNLPLANIVVKDAAVSFELSGFPAKFDGKLSEDGMTLSGTVLYRQEIPMAFSLKKTGPAKVTLPPKSGPLTQEFAGRWEGVLEAGGQSFRLVLRLDKAADGTATGAIDSLDQGSYDLRLAGIVIDGPALRFSLPLVGGAFEGQRNQEGTEITGRWSQGGATLPLTFKRPAKPAEPKK